VQAADKNLEYSQGAWFIGNSFANIFGGVVAYGIGQITTSPVSNWRLLFLILGSITSAYAFLLYLFLPDSPDKAVFLDEKQQQIALRRTIENKTGLLDSDNFVPSQVIDALTDPQLWLLVLYTASVNLANGGLTSVSPPPLSVAYHFFCPPPPAS
jgi:MFS family permease